jgi:L-alanine-DL-glutamate epimerase-like enolase superfamily enzyme
MATPNSPVIEFLAAEMCDSALRVELVEDPLTIQNGVLTLKDKPGIDVELNMDAIEKYEVGSDRPIHVSLHS